MPTSFHTTIRSLLALVLVIGLAGAANAASPAGDAGTAAESGQEMNLSQVINLLREQQQEMKTQRQLLERQSTEIANLKQELDTLRVPIVASSGLPVADKSLQTKIVTTGQLQEKVPPTEPKTTEELNTEIGKSAAVAQADDPARNLVNDYSGAWHIPGTSAVLGIGGYVKTSIVFNFDPLQIKDRFIVGSIPVGDSSQTGTEAESSITVSQSRINFDLHEATDVGIMRAFIEGDFAGEDDTFRLRHAFGQWQRVLAGKTWSTFVDTDATPEEVDFEGLNGRINVRQSQVRWMPVYGTDYEFQLSMEDPSPEIQNGDGVTKMPDLVASARFQPHDRLHVKLALLGRQIRAQQSTEQGGSIAKNIAWGLSLSGRFSTPLIDKKDSLLFQLNGGNGIGRYVNDLSSIGNYDGIFNPLDGNFELFDVLAGYVSWQHWWRGDLRSNLTLGVVNVDNPDFVAGDAYKRTTRASTNLIWAPNPDIFIGLEYLWGVRENEDGEDGSAAQIQMAVKYDF